MKTNVYWRTVSAGTPADPEDAGFPADTNRQRGGAQSGATEFAGHPFPAQSPLWPATGAAFGAEAGAPTAAPRSADDGGAQGGIANEQSGAQGCSSGVPFVYAPTNEQALPVDPPSWLNGGGAGVFADWQSLLGRSPHPTLDAGGLSSDIFARGAGANAAGTPPLLAGGFANDRFES